MKLPVPALLYSVAIGLLGWSGWTVHGMLPLLTKGVRDAAVNRGMKDGMDLIGRGKGKGTTETKWRYNPSDWWQGLKRVNLIGKLPPPPPDPAEEAKAKEKEKLAVIDSRPLEEVIELVSLVYDGKEGGTGGNTYVIVRYKPEANVEPPEWWVRENTPVQPASGAAGGRDTVVRTNSRPNVPPAANAGTAQKGGTPNAGRPPSPMPTSMTGREVLQKLWVQDEGDPRRSSLLWPVKSQSVEPGGRPRELGKVRLVRVASDAQSAFFTRELPVVDPSAAPAERKEEELLKTTMNIPQDVLVEMRRIQGKSSSVARVAKEAKPTNGSWMDVQETTRVGNVTHVGRRDAEMFREDSDRVFGRMQVDTYVSKSSSLRGLVVRNVEPELASRFGVVAGDVLVEINGKQVQSKEQAIQFGQADYNKGVRTFSTKWLSNGQVVERVIQAPDR